MQRFRTGFSEIPPMSQLGALWDRDVLAACRCAISIGLIIASELRGHGVDLTFAPVLDLDWGRSTVIGDRAFHSDPRVVTMLAANLMHGLALAGMASCGKHFPGHGWTAEDSHHEAPVDRRPLTQILDQDAAPYRCTSLTSQAIARCTTRGCSAPSPKTCGTCCSSTNATSWSKARAGAALDAGCDFILICNDLDAVDRVLAGLQWQRGPAFEQRLGQIAPRGAPASPDAWRTDPAYLAALRDLDQVSRT